MNKLLSRLSLALCLTMLATTAAAQQTRAYAPENLGGLTYNDQMRVISLEYSEQSNGRRIPDDQLRFYIDQVNRSNWSFSQIRSDIAQSLSGSGTDPYPPENLHSMSYDDQVRLISREYSEQSNGRRIPADKLHFYIDQVRRSDWDLHRIKADIAKSLSGPGTDPYPPENLHSMSYDDQVRLISREYSEQSNGRRIPDDKLRFYIDQVHRSDWDLNRIRSDIAKSLDESGTNQPPILAENVRCESSDGRARTCRTPWSGRSRLVQQLSKSPCEEGRSWQSQHGEVYVSNGCRAEFAAAPVAPPSTSRLRCESTSSSQITCTTPWQGRSRLTKQFSKTACIEGRSWGSTDGQVWVSHRCRGEFMRATTATPKYLVTCSSKGSPIPKMCAWDRNKGRPYLQTQLSRKRCIEGVTWGYNTKRANPALWVSAGCRARFGARPN